MENNKKTSLVAILFFLICMCVLPCFADANKDLIAACKNGKIDEVKKAIEEGAQVNSLDEQGNPALSSAFFWPEIVKYLLDKGADPNLGNQKPIYSAAMFYSVDALKMLLDAGADPNKPTLTDPTTLFKTLIATEKAKGKDANQAMINAWTSVMATAKPTEVYTLPTVVYGNACTSCVEMLLAKGAKIDLGVADGNLIHSFGSSTGKSRELWKQGYAAGKANIEGFGIKFPDWYSIDIAADRFGNPDDMLKLLLAKGLNINQKNSQGLTPLELSMGSGFGGHPEIALALVNNGADVKMVHPNNGPVLFQATQMGSVDVVKAMIEKGADINTEGRFAGQADVQLKGFTPLTIAASLDNLALVKYLMEAGAKNEIGIEGKFFSAKTGCVSKVADKTAIYFAIENGNVEMVKYMVDADVKWWKRVKIYQLKEKSEGTDIFGSAVTITTCFGAGEYTPSLYVNAVTKNKRVTATDKAGMTQSQIDGLVELKKAMQAKGI